jgi:hypothetical protein
MPEFQGAEAWIGTVRPESRTAGARKDLDLFVSQRFERAKLASPMCGEPDSEERYGG